MQFLIVPSDCKKRALSLSVGALMVMVALRSGGPLEGGVLVNMVADSLVVPSALAVIAISLAAGGIARGRRGGESAEGGTDGRGD